MNLRRAFPLVCLALLGGEHAAAKGFKDDVIEGAKHEVEAVKWHDDVARTSGFGCFKSKPDSKEGCVRNTLRIHNESAVTLQCRVTLELPADDELGHARYESDVVVFAGKIGEAVRSHGPIALVPTSFSSTCVAVPATPPPFEEVAEECKGSVTRPSLDDFYPPASVRREEQGDVWLEYAVEDGNKRLLDVRVVASSGYEEIDSAALKAARRISTTGQCPGRRYRIKVGFWLRDH